MRVRVGTATLLLLATAGAAAAQDALESLDRDVRALAERCGPAVVRVEAERVARLRAVPDAAEGERLRIEAVLRTHAPRERLGATGFLVEEGIVLTTAELGDRPLQSLRVRFLGGAERDGRVLGVDGIAGVAVLRVEPVEGVRALSLVVEARPSAGSVVVLLGRARALAPSMELGLVTAVDRAVGGYDAFVTASVPVFPGDAGGPLLDVRGRVLGMAVTPRSLPAPSPLFLARAPRAPGAVAPAGTEAPAPARFAVAAETNRPGTFVPAAELMRIVAEVKESGRVRRGLLGVLLRQGAEGGVEVDAVEEDSPAAAAGVRAEDRVLALDATPVSSVPELASFIQRRAPGTRVRLSLRAPDGKERVVEAVLAEYRVRQLFNGVSVAQGPGPGKAPEAGVPVPPEVLVKSVEPGSAAAAAGMREGDVLLSIGGVRVGTVEEYVGAATSPLANRVGAIDVVVRRDGAETILTLK